MSRVLLTGGTGFLGRRVVARLVDAGARNDPESQDAEALRRIDAADVDPAVLDPLLDALR